MHARVRSSHDAKRAPLLSVVACAFMGSVPLLVRRPGFPLMTDSYKYLHSKPHHHRWLTPFKIHPGVVNLTIRRLTEAAV